MVFRDETYRVLLVSAAEKFNTVTLSLLPGSEFHPVEVASTAKAALNAFLRRCWRTWKTWTKATAATT